MYQDAGQFVNEPTQWYNIDVVTGVSELQGFLNPINNVNAIGYNLLAHYIYGYDQTVHRIVRIDNTGNLMQLSSNPTGLPNNDFNVGTFDLDGHLFLFVNATSRFYTVDLNQESATFMNAGPDAIRPGAHTLHRNRYKKQEGDFDG